GVRRVVSHDAKHTRGVLTGHLLRRAAALPTSAQALAHAAAELPGVEVELHRERAHDVLTLVTRA
ncbi:MAG TPA: peroxide stress protein YaaA, partial [Actinotalea sp.]|nr:peroxide stress protein YaaA [Actinotalea sp.]